jgi:hypothetical protein
VAGRHDDYLLIRLREVCNSAPAGVEPWSGRKLCELAEQTSKQVAGHAGFYLQFMEGIRDLVSEEEDRILRRFLAQTLAAEPRLHADDQDIRDHLTHVTQVFLAGWIILNSCPVFRRFEAGTYGWKGAHRYFENLNRCWLYAALLHDCAYSVEYAKQALRHELMVRGLFEAYQLGKPGGSALEEIARLAVPLWKERAKWRDLQFDDDLSRFHEENQYSRLDHAIVGAIALWKEAEDQEKRPELELAQILKPAALAIACHNFQYLVGRSEAHGADEWFRLSLKTEPISVLLHICDELQEWGRERTDEAFVYKHVFKPVRYAATELAFLDVHDYDGLALDVRLLRRLYPEHRPVRHRIVREQERRIAETSKRFEKLFGPVEEKKKDERFHVRLRVQQTVDDTRCRQELRVDWPSQSSDVLKRLHDGWNRMYERSGPKSSGLEKTTFETEKGLRFEITSRKKGVATLPKNSQRVVILAAGATGKSTLLQKVARDFHDSDSVRYIDQLPEELADIQEELVNLTKDRRHHALLIVDHLDRLVEDENASFWLEQLSATSNIERLHIVLASRPEEYKRYFEASLRGFTPSEWDPKIKKPRLVAGKKVADSDGRMRAHAIESKLSRSSRLLSIAALAADMGQKRAVDLPVGMDLKGKIRTFTGTQEIIFRDYSGKARFLHDCVQDFFAAVHIAQSLSHNPDASAEDAIVVRRLERLPRDVVRFLFDFLGSNEEILLSKAKKKNAALRLARAFVNEVTIQQWLYDTGRLQQARHAIKEHIEKYGNNYPAIRLVSSKFLGHAEYEQFNPQKEDTRVHLKEAVRYWIHAALAADRLLQKENAESAESERYKWFLAFLVDHIFLALTKAVGDNFSPERLAEVQGWLRDKAEIEDTIDSKVTLQPGWVMSLLKRFSSVTHEKQIDELYCSVDDELAEFKAGGPSGALPEALVVRRAHLASHLGNHFLSESRKTNPDFERFGRAELYFQRSIYLRERVLRKMERNPMGPREVEVFSTLCQGYADNAHQYRGIFEYLFMLSPKCPVAGPADLAIRLVGSHRLQEDKWAQARLCRGASERLPNMFRTSLPWLATGRALTDLVEKLPSRDYKEYSVESVRHQLKSEADGLLKVYRQEGEAHARYPDDGGSDTCSVVWGKNKEKHAQTVLETVNIAAKHLSSSTART